jgi:hypothetical protein
MLSSGIWRRIVLVRTNVLEERIASIFRAGESRREYSEQVVAATAGIAEIAFLIRVFRSSFCNKMVLHLIGVCRYARS